MIKKKPIIYIIAIIIFISAYIYFFKLIFSESVYCKKWSINYILLIRSEVIREFPVIDKYKGVTYHHWSGPGQDGQGVSYVSKSKDKEYIYGIIDTFLSNKDYVINIEETDQQSYYYNHISTESKHIKLTIEQGGDNMYKVIATEYY